MRIHPGLLLEMYRLRTLLHRQAGRNPRNMQKTNYYCDHCSRIIGAVVHISLSIAGQFSGIALPPEVAVLEKWIIEPQVAGFYHFHMHCIQPFFMKKAKPYLQPAKESFKVIDKRK